MFVGKQLSNIRQMHEMSRAQLAKELNISEQAVWQYENSYTSPKLEMILKLAKFFDVKTKYFYKESIQYNVIEERNIAYRSINKNTMQKVLAEKIYLEHIEVILLLVEKTVKLPANQLFALKEAVLQKKVKCEYDCEKENLIEQIAEIARECVGLDSNNNNNLLFLLEKSGAFVLEKPMDIKVDGYSTWTTLNRPYIILNGIGKTAVRRNFDLAHELGHLLLHPKEDFLTLDKKSYNLKEKEAHTFASSFLLPKEEFLNDLKYISRVSNPKSYIDLKQKWNVSIAAMGRRAYSLNKMSYQQYRHFNALLRRYHFLKNEPLDDDLQFHSPGKIRSVIKHVLENGAMDISDLTETFNFNITKITKMLNLESNFFEKYLSKNQDFNFGEVRNFTPK
ncbi:MAG: XRE family transcriptional regulator [Bacillota bacterium]|uniref:spr1629 family repressor/antitoxin n=1 Tax=Virgibacillus salarius TaxID=447199 RepID=UPI0031D3C039